jgi:hypothetical protein
VSLPVGKMKKILAIASSIGALLVVAAPVHGQVQPQSAFAPTISFDNSNTSWGIENRSFLSDVVSLRSKISFSNSDPNVGTKYSTSLNYNFDMGDPAQTFSPFIGGGVSYQSGANSFTTGFAQAGLDMYFENLILTGSVAIPFSGDSGMATSIGIGLKF